MPIALALFAVAGAVLWLSTRDTSPAGDIAADPLPADPAAPDSVGPIDPGPAPAATTILGFTIPTVPNWKPPAAAAPYLDTIAQAEQSAGMPSGLLARVLYQESRFRNDIITGKTRSSAGAIGIAQFMPRDAQAMGVDPLDPNSAINGAADYLRRLFDRFGSWSDAVAAYNWGPGNWNSYKRTGKGAEGQPRPAENIAYQSQISADIGLS